MNIRLKLAAASIAAGSALVSMTGVAHAYDCFNASRSTKGAAGASNSQVWVTIPKFLAMGGMPQDAIDAVMVVVNNDPRIPANFAVYLNPHHISELATNMPERLATNGKGIDHADDYPEIFSAIDEDIAIALGGGA